jgi:hypothetical protein
MQHTFPYTDEAGKSRELVVDIAEDLGDLVLIGTVEADNPYAGGSTLVVNRAVFGAMVAEFAG